MIGRTIDQLAVGDAAELVREVAQGDILKFVESVGDRNPVHSDRAFAASTPFREPIAPGIWTAGLISAVIGMQLPGPGTIYVTQELRFLMPVKAGDSITTRVEVAEILPERNRSASRPPAATSVARRSSPAKPGCRPPRCPSLTPPPLKARPANRLPRPEVGHR